MATIIKTIGSSGRDYSTIAAWEADLDNTGVYTTGDNAIGYAFNDSIFVEDVVINQGTGVGLSIVQLIANSGQRHSGLAGLGVTIRGGINWTNIGTLYWRTIEGFELFSGDVATNRGIFINGNASTIRCSVRGNLVHDIFSTSESTHVGIEVAQLGGDITNCIVYNIVSSRTGSATTAGIQGPTGSGRACQIVNNTVYRVERNNSASTAAVRCIDAPSTNSNSYVRNCIGLNATGTSTGGKKDFDFGQSIPFTTFNLSSDNTASGANSFTGVLASDLFISSVSGSENLHLVATAIAVNNGTGIGDFPTGVNIDIDGRDRFALGDTWDIGADEFVNNNRHLLTLLGVG